MTDPTYYVRAFVAAGPHQTLVGTFNTPLMDKDACLNAAQDLGAVPLPSHWTMTYGKDAKIVAAECRIIAPDRTDTVLIGSATLDRLDWAEKPKNGQPSVRP